MEKFPATSGGSQRSPSPPRYKGVRQRKWGSWVAEVRYPHSRERLWLGSYPTAEQAARAFDAALYCLRGPGAAFNFPDRPPSIPSADKLSKEEIRAAVARFAWEAAAEPMEAEAAAEKMTGAERMEEMVAVDPAVAVAAAAEEETAMEGFCSSSPAGGGGGGEWWNEEDEEGCGDFYRLWSF